MTINISHINEVKRVLQEKPNKTSLLIVGASLDIPLLRSYIFRQLISCFGMENLEIAVEWFKFIYDRHAFDYTNIPGPIKLRDRNGTETYGYQVWEACFPIWEAAKYNEERQDLSQIILSLIDDYIQFAKEHENDPQRNFACDYYFCQYIFLISEQSFKDQYLNFVIEFGIRHDKSLMSSDITESFFYKALKWKDSKMLFRLLNLFFDPSEPIVNNRFKINSSIDNFYLEQFVKRVPSELYARLNGQGVDWAIGKLMDLNTRYPYSFTTIDVPSLEPDAQNNHLEGVHFSLVNLTVSLLLLEPVKFLQERMADLSMSDLSMIRRVSFFLIDKYYNDFEVFFWQQENPLSDYNSKLEIYRLLERHCAEFSEVQVKQLVSWINELKYQTSEIIDEQTLAKYNAFQKLEWTLALKEIHYHFNAIVGSLYQSFKDYTDGLEPRHPGYNSYSEISSGREYDKESIIDKPVREVIKVLANPSTLKGYNNLGLQDDIREFVVSRGDGVLETIEQFYDIPIPYLYNFLDAFRVLIGQKARLDLRKLYSFLGRLVTDRNDLWNFDKDEREKSSAINMIAWLIRTVATTDDLPTDSSVLKNGIDILIQLESRYTPRIYFQDKDNASDIINTTRGKIYDAMINSCLKEVKRERPTVPYWDKNIEELFSNRVVDHSFYPEFFWSVGFYTAQISYLNFAWLRENKTMIFKNHSELGGDVAFWGYLSLTSGLYSDLFKLLHDRYEEALSSLTEPGIIMQRLVEHIFLAFWNDIDEYDLLKSMLGKRNPEHFRYVVDRMNSNQEDFNDEKLLILWTELLKDSSSYTDLRPILAGTAGFINFVKNLDEVFIALFQEAVKIIDNQTPIYNLVRKIHSRSEITGNSKATRLITILLSNEQAALQHSFRDINEFIKGLYDKGEIRLADEIAEASALKMNFESVDIYNKYHKVNGVSA